MLILSHHYVLLT